MRRKGGLVPFRLLMTTSRALRLSLFSRRCCFSDGIRFSRFAHHHLLSLLSSIPVSLSSPSLLSSYHHSPLGAVPGIAMGAARARTAAAAPIATGAEA